MSKTASKTPKTPKAPLADTTVSIISSEEARALAGLAPKKTQSVKRISKKIGLTQNKQPIWTAESGFARVHKAMEAGKEATAIVKLMLRSLPKYDMQDHEDALNAHVQAGSPKWLCEAHILTLKALREMGKAS